MKIKLILITAAVALLSGCGGSSKMMVQENQQLVSPAAGKAQVVFLRSTFVGSAIQASVFDVTSGEPEFIGIVANDTKLAHTTDPGKHVFMVVSEAADYMEADLAAGKTYYSMVTPRMGAWKARFSMHPVRNGGTGEFQYDSERFKEWLERTKFVSNTAASEAWAAENMSNIKGKHARYWEVWLQKSPEDLAERTLNADDGV